MARLLLRGGTVVDGSGSAPFTADVELEGDRIVAVGKVARRAGARVIDADGLLVTPGFVDAHTHYDGQATWDEELAPSVLHGVTTAIMGNCGVGFAPARPEERDFLVAVMEGVEEIPGAVMDAGLTWDWETFPEYLSALASKPRAIDVATQVPHCALRCYVMGEERAHDVEARPDDVDRMASLAAEALRAGALGFSTSRTVLHRSRSREVVPGTHCGLAELLGIAGALRAVGHGVFQLTSDEMGRSEEASWLRQIAAATGGPVLHTLAQLPSDPSGWRASLDALDVAAAAGLDVRAGVPWRPPGVLLGMNATLHPFSTHPSFPRVAPGDARVSALREPALRARLLEERPTAKSAFMRDLLWNFELQFELGAEPDYEPPPEASLAARARREGQRPEVLAYDRLLEGNGETFLYRPIASYVAGDFAALREMLCHPRAIASLSDAGAHVGSLCDASVTTYMLSHWCRDRRRGPGLPVEAVVRKQTSETAALYGLRDRGRVAVGLRADLNLIDLPRLRLGPPVATLDLPAGGRRLQQRAEGFRATIVAGEVVAEDGLLTGARPGALIRGPQS